MRIVPLTVRQANEVVARLHRHHKPVRGHRFSIGVEVDGELVGCAIIGRPVSREVAHYSVAEVTRVATDGTKNTCSLLYGAAARIAREMGFDKIQTYTLESESGTSLRASGWTAVATTKGGDWNDGERKGRRVDQPQEPKIRWEKTFR